MTSAILQESNACYSLLLPALEYKNGSRAVLRLWSATACYCRPCCLQVIQQEHRDGSMASSSVAELLAAEFPATILSTAGVATGGLPDQAKLLAYEVAVMFNVHHLNVVQVGLASMGA